MYLNVPDDLHTLRISMPGLKKFSFVGNHDEGRFLHDGMSFPDRCVSFVGNYDWDVGNCDEGGFLCNDDGLSLQGCHVEGLDIINDSWAANQLRVLDLDLHGECQGAICLK